MATNPSDARDLLAMRNSIQAALSLDELRDVNWRALANAAAPAIARGWTGDELARWAIAELGRGAENPGAVMLTAIRERAAQDPPRESTPTPPPARSVLADIHRGQQASTRTAEHLATIRQTIRRTP